MVAYKKMQISADRMVLGLVCIAAAALLWLGVPRALGALLARGAEPAIREIQNSRHPTVKGLEAGIGALNRAISLLPTAQWLTDLAMLELELAARLNEDDPKRLEGLRSAEAHVGRGLEENPTSGYAWLRLAIIRDLRGAPPQEVATALLQSQFVAPNQRGLWLPRSEYMFSYWRALGPEGLLSFRRQLYTIWLADETMRVPLMKVANRYGQLPLIAWALSGDAQEQEVFERLKPSL